MRSPEYKKIPAVRRANKTISRIRNPYQEAAYERNIELIRLEFGTHAWEHARGGNRQERRAYVRKLRRRLRKITKRAAMGR